MAINNICHHSLVTSIEWKQQQHNAAKPYGFLVSPLAGDIY